jgi:hypothetical protein
MMATQGGDNQENLHAVENIPDSVYEVVSAGSRKRKISMSKTDERNQQVVARAASKQFAEHEIITRLAYVLSQPSSNRERSILSLMSYFH